MNKRYEIGPFSLSMDSRLSSVSGRILDIGGGGDGIIAQCYGNTAQVVAIDRTEDELVESGGNALKIKMDATSLKFLPGQFDVATSFFAMLYIHGEKKERVFHETFRVLKPGGRFFIWDTNIDYLKLNSLHNVFLIHLNIRLPDGHVVNTGYGAAIKKGSHQTLELLKYFSEKSGFLTEEEKSEEYGFFISFRKPKD